MEQKEVFKVHVDGPDAGDINEGLERSVINGFLMIAFTEDGAALVTRNVDAKALVAVIGMNDALRKAATMAVLYEQMKKLTEEHDGKEIN